jgi:hypothetical protein
MRRMQAAGIDAFGGDVHLLELPAPGAPAPGTPRAGLVDPITLSGRFVPGVTC